MKLLTSFSGVHIDSSLRSCTALSLAVYQGDQEIAKILLESGANVNKLSKDWNGRLETPLFSACRLGHKNIAEMLLNSGADVNTSDFYMHSPLWIATRERALELVEVLIANSADLNAGDRCSQNPLYLATKYLGRSEIAKTLIRHGCKIDLTDGDGRGALYWSLANHQLDVFRMLIYAGAHVNRKGREIMTNRSLPADIKDNQEFNEWLNTELKNPPSLIRLSAKSVRNRLSSVTKGKTIFPNIEILPVPEKLKDFLKITGDF